MKLSSLGRQPGHSVYPGYFSAEYLITKTGPDKVLKAVDQPLASNYYFPPVRDWGRLQCRLQLRVVIIGTKPNKHPHWETSLTQHHPPCTLHTNITTTTTTILETNTTGMSTYLSQLSLISRDIITAGSQDGDDVRNISV